MLLQATPWGRIYLKTTLSAWQDNQKRRIEEMVKVFKLKISSRPRVIQRFIKLTPLRPKRSVIFPQITAPTIPPIVKIEPKTEYCKERIVSNRTQRKQNNKLHLNQINKIHSRAAKVTSPLIMLNARHIWVNFPVSITGWSVLHDVLKLPLC